MGIAPMGNCATLRCFSSSRVPKVMSSAATTTGASSTLFSAAAEEPFRVRYVIPPAVTAKTAAKRRRPKPFQLLMAASPFPACVYSGP
jgi:hypothetical protein